MCEHRSRVCGSTRVLVQEVSPHLREVRSKIIAESEEGQECEKSEEKAPLSLVVMNSKEIIRLRCLIFFPVVTVSCRKVDVEWLDHKIQLC